MIKNKIIILFVWIVFGTQAVRYDTYNNKIITLENIHTIASQAPQNLQKEVFTFFEKNPKARRVLVEQKDYLQGLKKYLQEKKARVGKNQEREEQGEEKLPEIKYSDPGKSFLKANSLKNLSNFNYVIDLTGEIVLKISGRVNRLYLEGTGNGMRWGDIVKKESIEKIIQNRVKTYQTASRMFYYVRMLEAKEKFNLSKIEVPKTYLVKLNKSKSNEDFNMVVVHEKLSDKEYVSLDKVKDKHTVLMGKDKKGKILAQLLVVIRYAGIWNPSDLNVLVNKKTENLALIDFEQPNTMKLEQSWNKMTEKDKENKNKLPERYLHSVTSGIQLVYGYSKNEAYRKKLNVLVNKHPELKNHWSLKDYLSGKK
jgi:hypothetical protein